MRYVILSDIHANLEALTAVLDRIAELADKTPRGEWIVTMPVGEPPFYEGVPGNLAENRFPTRQELDHVAPDHPVPKNSGLRSSVNGPPPAAEG